MIKEAWEALTVSSELGILGMGAWSLRETPDGAVTVYHPRWGVLVLPHNVIGQLWGVSDRRSARRMRREGRFISAVFVALAQMPATHQQLVLATLRPFTDSLMRGNKLDASAVFWNVYKAALAEARRARVPR